MRMNIFETITAYLTRIQLAQDELAIDGETMIDLELVKVAMKGCIKHWTTFVDEILARKKPLDWS